MTKSEQRRVALQQAGLDTTKHFQITINEDLPKGSVLTINVNKGNAEVSSLPACFQETAKNIFQNGYVKNTKVHRRWIMAQTMKMLESKGGYSQALKNYTYQYTFNMMLEEIRVLSILEKSDKEIFKERSQFFNKEVVVQVLKDYENKACKYLKSIYYEDYNFYCFVTRHSRFAGFTYSTVQQQLKQEVGVIISTINNFDKTYEQLFYTLRSFIKTKMIILPSNTTKSSAWIDAYKGAGAYYTLQNLIKFHGCTIRNYISPITGRMTMNDKRDVYSNLALLEFIVMEIKQGHWWRLQGLLKQVINDNGFDFHERMEKLYD